MARGTLATASLGHAGWRPCTLSVRLVAPRVDSASLLTFVLSNKEFKGFQPALALCGQGCDMDVTGTGRHPAVPWAPGRRLVTPCGLGTQLGAWGALT